MPIIEIYNASGSVANTIVATPEFAEEQHPGSWRLADAQEAPAVPQVPQVCTPAQGERAMFDLRGITHDDVLAAIDLIEDADNRYRARSAFLRTTEWRRSSETVQTLAALLNLSDADLDELFAYAVYVNV